MSLYIPFTETNPDKGTETSSRIHFSGWSGSNQFTEINPDKGTETIQQWLEVGDIV